MEGVLALTAQAQDSARPTPERIAALKEVDPLLRAASRGENAAAVAEKLLEQQYPDFAFGTAVADAGAYIALGDLMGHANVAQSASFICARFGSGIALCDGWGSHCHPEWQHRWFDAAYVAFKAGARQIAERFASTEGGGSDAVLRQARAEELVALLNEDEGVGSKAINSCLPVFLGPHGLGGTATAVIVAGGAYEAASTSLREDPLDSVEMYVSTLLAAMVAAPTATNPELTTRLFESGVLEAVVARIQRAQAAEKTPVHVNVNRCTGQLVTGVATTAEGRAKLKATVGLEGALMWLLENGGDPIGIAENNTLADPCGMAGLCMALLRGREEDAQLALPGKVVRQIVQMIDTYYGMGGASLVAPYVQGLNELSVSDANKEHLKSLPTVIDSLRACLRIDSGTIDPNAEKLQTSSCSTLAQLSASSLTLPMLIGHPVLEDLEQLSSMPETSKDARNDAMAVLFAVHQHEKAKVEDTDGPASPKSDSGDGQHVMISYEWSVQPIIIRIRDGLVRHGYRVWLDVRG